MECAGHVAVALEFARIADVDEHDVVAAVQRDRLLGRQRLDRRIGLVAELLDADRDVLRH